LYIIQPGNAAGLFLQSCWSLQVAASARDDGCGTGAMHQPDHHHSAFLLAIISYRNRL